MADGTKSIDIDEWKSKAFPFYLLVLEHIQQLHDAALNVVRSTIMTPIVSAGLWLAKDLSDSLNDERCAALIAISKIYGIRNMMEINVDAETRSNAQRTDEDRIDDTEAGKRRMEWEERRIGIADEDVSGVWYKIATAWNKGDEAVIELVREWHFPRRERIVVDLT